MASTRDLALQDYQPASQLIVKETTILEPRFPVIDAHNHLVEPFGGGWDKRPLPELIALLDQARVEQFVDLDGGWGEEILQAHLDKFKQKAPERFVVFGGVDWSTWAEKGNAFPEWAASRLRVQARWGAQGLKIWKPFGLTVRDHHDQRVAVDDPRLEPIWATAGELGLPVLVHVADPVAFFQPLDKRNERWEELAAHPDWHFPSPPFPPFLAILTQFRNLVKRQKDTIFIGAHVGCYGENLTWVASMLDESPNYFIDISARISELGRQPYSARRFFLNYADRILFGSDFGPSLPHYRIYYRFLETDDEYFDYGPGPTPTQGRWNIYGLNLPAAVLEKVYHLNARRILPIAQENKREQA